MKHAILAIIFSLISCLSYAGDSTELTQGHINGRAWKKLSQIDKYIYLQGIGDGIITMFSLSSGLNITPDESTTIDKEYASNMIKSIAEFNRALLFTKLTYQDICTKLDEIYMDVFNVNIPVHEIYANICLQYHIEKGGVMVGGTLKPLNNEGYSLESELRALRKNYN